MGLQRRLRKEKGGYRWYIKDVPYGTLQQTKAKARKYKNLIDEKK